MRGKAREVVKDKSVEARSSQGDLVPDQIDRLLHEIKRDTIFLIMSSTLQTGSIMKISEAKHKIIAKDQPLKRTSDSVASKSKNLFIPVDQHRRIVERLEDQVFKLNGQIQQLQEEHSKRKSVFLRREGEYKQIIKQYQEEFSSNRNLPQQVRGLNEAINISVEALRENVVQNTQKFIQRERAKFQNKLQEAHQSFKAVMEKQHRISKELQSKMLGLFENTRQMASKIYDENVRLTTQLKQSKFKNQIIFDQRNLLISQLMSLKLTIKNRRLQPNHNFQQTPQQTAKAPLSAQQKQRRNSVDVKDACISNLQRTIIRQRLKSKRLLGELISSKRNIGFFTQHQLQGGMGKSKCSSVIGEHSVLNSFEELI